MDIFRKKEAFSLMELLVAVAIMGVAIAPLVSGIVRSWKVSLEATRQSRAVMLSQWKLNQQLGTVDFGSLQNIQQSGCNFDSHVPVDNNLFGCEVTVSNQAGSTDNFEVKKIEVKIFYDSILTGKTRTIQCSDVNNCGRPDRVTYRTKFKK